MAADVVTLKQCASKQQKSQVRPVATLLCAPGENVLSGNEGLRVWPSVITIISQPFGAEALYSILKLSYICSEYTFSELQPPREKLGEASGILSYLCKSAG